jgi:hypothetical protein
MGSPNGQKTERQCKPLSVPNIASFQRFMIPWDWHASMLRKLLSSIGLGDPDKIWLVYVYEKPLGSETLRQGHPALDAPEMGGGPGNIDDGKALYVCLHHLGGMGL